MARNQISYDFRSDQIPPLSAKYPWLVSQTMEDKNLTGDQIFFTLSDPSSQYSCRIPELLGRRIRACFHGWVILSKHPHDVMWFLWNPQTSKLIRLPPLINHKEEDDNLDCCLSAPPDDPSSVLLITSEHTFIFCRLDRKRKKLRWTEMSYAKQLKSITRTDGNFLHCPTYFNGKLYALSSNTPDCEKFVIQIDIVVSDREVTINLSPLVKCPSRPCLGCCMAPFLKGSSSDLFFIYVGMKQGKLYKIYLFRLDMTSMTFEKIKDLKRAEIFVSLSHDYSVVYSPAIASDLGGYIHILFETDTEIYSYHINDKTFSLSYMPYLDLPPSITEPRTSYVSLWSMPECWFRANHGEIKTIVDSKEKEDKEDELAVNGEVDNQESYLLNIPFNLLEIIMDNCVGVDYMNFRATCKRCHLAAPQMPRSDEATLRKLQTDILASPWLMVLDEDRGIISFKHPLSDEKYFIRTPEKLFGDIQVHCSSYGWLLISKDRIENLMFFNPLTSDIRELPRLGLDYLDSFCFSSPPTSSDCMVVGLTTWGECNINIHFVAREQTWLKVDMSFDTLKSYSFAFPQLYDGDLYALLMGDLVILEESDEEGYSFDYIKSPTSCCTSMARYFLVKCDQDLLRVVVGEFGETVEVLRLNDLDEWEKIDSLGKHMIYICDMSCICIEAKTPRMENKIYFPQLLIKNGKIVFYSLETCRYHTFNAENIEGNFKNLCETKQHLYPHAWIEPAPK